MLKAKVDNEREIKDYMYCNTFRWGELYKKKKCGRVGVFLWCNGCPRASENGGREDMKGGGDVV